MLITPSSPLGIYIDTFGRELSLTTKLSRPADAKYCGATYLLIRLYSGARSICTNFAHRRVYLHCDPRGQI